MLEVKRGRAEPIDKQGTMIRFKVPLAGRPSEDWKVAFRQCLDTDVAFFDARVTLHADHVTFQTEEENVGSGIKKIDDAIAVANSTAAQVEERKKLAKQVGRQAEVDKRQELERLKDKFKNL
ncbi:MAG TPA: hypothetical protein VLF19_10085 [Methylomirabilota bacterium]|nr:hypothetical protein [Methylomirabilota bacterium]